jgi:hypothetical protein
LSLFSLRTLAGWTPTVLPPALVALLALAACDDGTGAFRSDGDADGDTIPDEIERGDGDEPRDTDGDLVPDWFDLDSDGDGIEDPIEAGDDDPSTSPIDSDGDGLADYIDLDSDNNGIPDSVEGPTEDFFGDGVPDYRDMDDDADNLTDELETRGIVDPPLDSDGDGIPNYRDLDSDNDLILDGHERDRDSDRDGLPDREDLDSDNDGYPDRIEAGDEDIRTIPVDTDEDGIPDFIDLDSDNDGLSDAFELSFEGAPLDRVAQDSDGDGATDLIELGAGSDPLDGDDNPEERGDFVFVVPFEEDPQPERRTLEFGTALRFADVYFSLDETGSMFQEFEALRASVPAIVEELSCSTDGQAPDLASLQRVGRGSNAASFRWEGPAPSSFGRPNDDQELVAPSVGVVTPFLNELRYDAPGGRGRVEVVGPAGLDLLNYAVEVYREDGTLRDTIPLDGIITDQAAGLGARSFGASLPTGRTGLALVDPDGNLLEFLSYEGVVTASEGPASGQESTDIGVVDIPELPDEPAELEAAACIVADPDGTPPANLALNCEDANNTCHNGRCARRCALDDECAEGFACDTDAVEAICARTCSVNADCSRNFRCDQDSGFCREIPNQTGCIDELWTGVGRWNNLDTFHNDLSLQPDPTAPGAFLSGPFPGSGEVPEQAAACVADGDNCANDSTKTCSPVGIGCAGFRADAIKIVVQITDANNQCFGARCPLFTPEFAGSELLRQGIFFIGLAGTGDDFSGPPFAIDVAREIAFAAGSVDEDGEPFVFPALDAEVVRQTVQAVQKLVGGANFRITAEVLDEPNDAGDSLQFVERLEVNRDPALPECTGILLVSDENGDTFPDTFPRVRPGTPVCWDLVAAPNEAVRPTEGPQVFRARVEVRANGSLVDDTRVFFLVPPLIDTGIQG